MFRFPLVLCLIVFSGSFLHAQDTLAVSEEDTTAQSWFDWLYSGTDSILEMTIETDVRQLIRQKLREEYQEAKLSVRNANGEVFEQELRIRARGNRRKEVCFYPPIKLKFKKADLTAAGFSKSNEFKLVTQCRDTETCSGYTSKEYLIYKLYGLVSPYHYRVQLLKITFVDVNGKGKTREMLGFLIEPEEEMAGRLQVELIDRSSMRSSFVSDEPHQLMAIFQYMIGNTDWSIGNSHNLTFIKAEEFTRLVPIPYDFDYSGLVNTDYAIPFHTLPIKSVTERLYRGIECTESEIPGWVSYYQSRQSAIMEYVEHYPHLDDDTRKEVTRYLSEFFEFLDNPRFVRTVLGTN